MKTYQFVENYDNKDLCMQLFSSWALVSFSCLFSFWFAFCFFFSSLPSREFTGYNFFVWKDVSLRLISFHWDISKHIYTEWSCLHNQNRMIPQINQEKGRFIVLLPWHACIADRRQTTWRWNSFLMVLFMDLFTILHKVNSLN